MGEIYQCQRNEEGITMLLNTSSRLRNKSEAAASDHYQLVVRKLTFGIRCKVLEGAVGREL